MKFSAVKAVVCVHPADRSVFALHRLGSGTASTVGRRRVVHQIAKWHYMHLVAINGEPVVGIAHNSPALRAEGGSYIDHIHATSRVGDRAGE